MPTTTSRVVLHADDAPHRAVSDDASMVEPVRARDYVGDPVTNPVVPQAAPLSHVKNVELMHTGTWEASTGTHTFDTGDLACAVASQDCPAVRRPILKLGHTDPRFDGQPAVGYIGDLRLDGYTLSGDYIGMPGWMTAEVLASAYPDRSIEGEYDYRCAIGHTHPFILTAVALLGETRPAIGTLESLQDVAMLYGVAASGADRPVSESFVSVTMKGGTMPNPRSTTVAAGVTTEDVRRAYYDANPSWELWIEEMHLDPLQLIVVNDANGERIRVPITAAGDGAEGVTFGEAVPVVIRYEDATPAAVVDPAAPVPEPVAASAAIVRFSSRSESRPGSRPAASDPITPVTTDPAEPGTDEGADMALTMTDEQTTAVFAALSLDATATADDVLAAIEELATAPEPATPAVAAKGLTPASVKASASKLGLVVLEPDALEARLSAGERALATLEERDRNAVVDVALSTGRITPARREHYVAAMRHDPEGTREFLEGLPAEFAVSLSEVGHGQDSTDASDDARTDEVLKGW